MPGSTGGAVENVSAVLTRRADHQVGDTIPGDICNKGYRRSETPALRRRRIINRTDEGTAGTTEDKDTTCPRRSTHRLSRRSHCEVSNPIPIHVSDDGHSGAKTGPGLRI